MATNPSLQYISQKLVVEYKFLNNIKNKELFVKLLLKYLDSKDILIKQAKDVVDSAIQMSFYELL